MGGTSLAKSPELLDGLGEVAAGYFSSITPVGSVLPISPPTFGESFGAAFAQENTIANFVRYTQAPSFQEDPDFEYTDDLLPPDLMQFKDHFDGARSMFHLEFLIGQAREEQERKEIIAASGTGVTLLAYAAAGLIAPETLLPIGAGFKAAGVGASLVDTAIIGTAVASGEQAVAELALQQFQTTRTAAESRKNVLGAALFGSVLGGIGGVYGKAHRAALTEMVEISARIDKADAELMTILQKPGMLDDAGKLKVDDAEVIRIVEDEILANNPDLERMIGTGNSLLRRFWTWGIARTPSVRSAASRSTVIRVLSSKMSQTALVRKVKGRAHRPAIEAEVLLTQGRGLRAVDLAKTEYKAYRKAIAGKGIRRMTEEEYYHNAVRAARRETIDPDTGRSVGRWDPPTEVGGLTPYRGLSLTDTAAHAAVRNGAKVFREFQDHLKELGNEASGHLTISELAPNSIDRTANSYVHRVYDQEFVVENHADFDEVLRQGMLSVDPEIKINADELVAVRQKITGEQSPVGGHVTITDASGEARSILIRDDFVASIDGRAVAFEDFLDSSLPSVISKQIHIFVPRMVMARRLAGPAHVEALKLKDAWTVARKALNGAADEDLPHIANEIDKLRSRVNDVHTLEVMHGQGTREWRTKADSYRQAASERDRLMDAIVEIEDVIDELDAATARATDHLDVRMAAEVEATTALGGPKAERRVALRLEVEKADLKLKQGGKKRLDIEAEVDRVWRMALLGKRVQGALAPARKAARALIKGDPDLKELGKRYQLADGIDVEAAQARIAELRSHREASIVDSEATREDLVTVRSMLNRQRKDVKDTIRADDTNEMAVFEPDPVRVLEDATSNDVREVLDAELAAAFTRVSATRQSLASNAENLKWWDRQAKAEFDRFIAEAGDDEKLVRKLQKEKETALSDAQHMRLQTFGSPIDGDPKLLGARGGRILRSFNYVTKMGGMTLSSIPDMAMGIFTAGLMPWAKMMARFLRDPRLRSLSKEELAHILVASETTMGSLRMARLGDVADILGGHGKVGRVEGALGAAGVGLTKLSLMKRWNATWKGFASVALAQRTNTIVGKAGKLSKAERQFLELSGINDEMANRIRGQLKKHGDHDRELGVKVVYAMSERWDDTAAREVYEAAMVQNVNRTIITPGAGELPQFSRDPIGRLILQFRSFSIAASQQVALSGGQRLFSSGDMAVVQGIIALYSMGMMTEWIKAYINRGPEEAFALFDKPALWAVNGLDRSGLLGVVADLNAISETFTNNRIGLSAIHGENTRLSRFASRNAASVLLGPSVGQASHILQLGFLPSKLLDPELAPTASDRTNFRRMIPFQNLWQIRLLLDDMVPRHMTGERKRIEEYLVSDDDLGEINSAFERLISQPPLN